MLKKFWDKLLPFLSIILLIAVTKLQCELNFRSIYNFSILNEDFFTIYGLIFSIFSALGIYYAIIPFVMELTSSEKIDDSGTFFGIIYTKYLFQQDKSFVLATSKTFGLISGCFFLLPIIYKLTNVILFEYIWNSLFIFVGLSFVYFLFSTLRIVQKSLKKDALEKRDELYKFLSSNYRKDLEKDINKIDDSKYNESFRRYVSKFTNYYIKELLDDMIQNKYDRSYFYNKILGDIFKESYFQNDKANFDYLMEVYFKFLTDNKVQLYFEERVDQYGYKKLHYPLLTYISKTLEDLKVKSISSLSFYGQLIEFLDIQEYIDDSLLMNFLFDILYLYDKDSKEELDALLDFILKEDVIEEWKFVKFLDNSPLFDGNQEPPNVDMIKIYIWEKVIENYHQSEFFIKGKFEYKTDYKYEVFNMGEYSYSIACLVLLKKSKDDDLISNIEKSLDDDSLSILREFRGENADNISDWADFMKSCLTNYENYFM